MTSALQVAYHKVEVGDRPGFMDATVGTQTDPVSSADECDGFEERRFFERENRHDDVDEGLYEEIDPPASMDRALLMEQSVDYEVEPGSAAAKDGRVKVGDQILQINGRSVNSRDEAMRQFQRHDLDTISLLLARPSTEQDDDDEDVHVEVEAGSAEFGTPNLPTLAEFDDSNTENSLKHEKDSGLSRTTDSEPDLKKAATTARPCAERHLERELQSLHREMENVRLECARLMSRQAERRQPSSSRTLLEMLEQLGPPSRPDAAGRASRTSRADLKSPTPLRRTAKTFERAPAHAPPAAHAAYDDATSSAYNTGGDSCRSTPNKHDYVQLEAPQTTLTRPVQLSLGGRRGAPAAPVLSPTASEHPYQTIDTPVVASRGAAAPALFRLPNCSRGPPAPAQPNGTLRRCQVQQGSDVPQINFKPGDIMYTSPDKLAETIALQQRLLKQSLGSGAAGTLRAGCSLTPGHHAEAPEPEPQNNNTYEWKIKRRADGTRYITRRPLRAQVLKAREEQLNRERHGLSTDDDACSDLKTGRFWPRQARKQHLERQRERKWARAQQAEWRRRQAELRGEPLIRQLSDRKQVRQQNRLFFDKFTTIQEFLAHGARDPTLRPVAGVLSVTTV